MPFSNFVVSNNNIDYKKSDTLQPNNAKKISQVYTILESNDCAAMSESDRGNISRLLDEGFPGRDQGKSMGHDPLEQFGWFLNRFGCNVDSSAVLYCCAIVYCTVLGGLCTVD